MNLLSAIALGLAILCGLIAAYFVVRGLNTRQRVGSELYAVGRQARRRTMQVNLVRSAAFLVLALIALVVFGLSQRPTAGAGANAETTATSTPALVTATSAPALTTATSQPSPVPSPATTREPASSPTTPPDIPTLTPTPTETPTPTPRPPTALVNSPNGLYLREAPGGTQELELIADGAELVLLEGRETVDDLEWQRVLTPAGNEGWVALEFIVIQETP